MKTRLIKKGDWHNLLKMGNNELLRFLQDNNYKEEIDMLKVDSTTPSDIEMALNKNLIRVFQKLMRISDESMKHVLTVYFKRYDKENFKTIIRGKKAGIEDEDIKRLLLPSANFSEKFFETLIKTEHIKDIVKKLPWEIKEVDDMYKIENEIDRAYYEELFDLAQNIRGSESDALKEFIRAEVQITNLKVFLRLKIQQMPKDDILSFLIRPAWYFKKLIDFETVQEMVPLLLKVRLIRSAPDSSLSQIEQCKEMEIDTETALLKKEANLMIKYPLTVNVILGFMFLKEIEVRNLKVLLKGKRFGLDQSYIEKLMVVA